MSYGESDAPNPVSRRLPVGVVLFAQFCLGRKLNLLSWRRS